MKTQDDFESSDTVTCLGCRCSGSVRIIDDRLKLVPIISRENDHFHRKRLKCQPNSHGFGTVRQMMGVLVYGSTFWVLVMVVTNVINLQSSKQEPSYVTTVCHAGFKVCISVSQDFMACSYLLHECKSSRVFNQPEPRRKLDQKPTRELSFSEEENLENLRRCKINKFLDAKTCKYLCRQFSVTLVQEENHCKDVCFTLSRSEKTAGEICPYEKYCPDGCPCPFYECEKSAADRQRLSPAWDLSTSRKIQIESTELIYSRDTLWDELPNQKRDTNVISTYRIIFYNHENGSKKLIDTSKSKSLEHHGVGSTFLAGRHYLVDAKANMFKVDETKSELQLVIESRRLGYFMFHFYSAIGTYRIKTAHEGEFGIVVICSSNSLTDKCFYYAPERNLHRFEFGQGLVANNHWNAKTTAFAWGDRFYLISLRYGENNMRTSHTLSIDPFRIVEENVKGWKKETKSFPSELNGLEPVDVIPLVDQNRLLFVIISRSRELSNVKYSLFLNLNNQLVDIGSEWIGNLAKYTKYDLCFSALFSMNDPFYNLPGRDECEYFQNSFIVNDRIYIQSLIFDSTFEMDFDFENLELVFIHKTKHESILLASNPDFAYHDDVFPGFSKNAVSQQNFPKHRCGGMESCVVIVPSYTYEASERVHISSVDFKDDWKFSFQIIGFGQDGNVIEIVHQSGDAFLTVSASGKISKIRLNIQIGATKIAVIPEMIKAATEIEIHFDKLAGKTSIFQIKPFIRDGITGTKKIATLLREFSVPKNVFPSQNTQLKVFAENIKLRDFYYFLHYESTMVLISHMPDYCTECNLLRITSASGFYSSDVKLKFPTDNIYTYNQYLTLSLAAMIRGIAYFFGGTGGFDKGDAKNENLRKIAYLDGCEVKEHQTRLGIYVDGKGSAVSFEDDGRSFAIVCFDIYRGTGPSGDFGNFRDKACETFDGSTVRPSFFTKFSHRSACLGTFKGRPTAVGSFDMYSTSRQPGDPDYIGGQVETLGQHGWESIEKHPADPSLQTCLEVPRGMLTIGGVRTNDGEDIIDIWMLKTETSKWSKIGKTQFVSKHNVAIQLNGEIFVWSGDRTFLGLSEGGSRHLEKLNWHGENLTSTVIRRDTHYSWSPYMLDVDFNFCLK